MIGPIADSASLAVGGLIGALLGRFIPKRIKETLPLIFGVITVSMGSLLVGKASYLHVVVLALILGSIIGELFYFERGLEWCIRKSMQWSRKRKAADDAFVIQFVTLIAAMCFGSMGLFGAINEGITGNPEILLTKAALDFFTALIFGAVLGLRVSFIAVPQFAILAGLYFSAAWVMPLVNAEMLGDFSSCGGVIFLATGLRMCGIKVFPVINMLPALLVVMPLSALWAAYFAQ